MNLRNDARTIFNAALNAASPRAAIHRAVQRDAYRLRVQNREYDLMRVQRVFVIGFGKAGATMV